MAEPDREGLGLRARDWVEVKSAEEILATLDASGLLDGLPFMPEMLEYCGKRFPVYKSAHKTCDTFGPFVTRRMANAVHLEGLRCGGGAHGGCQAACLLFWKEAWLRRADGPRSTELPSAMPSGPHPAAEAGAARCDQAALQRATRVASGDAGGDAQPYRCQATELQRATTRVRWWDPRHYVKDLTSGNVNLLHFIKYVAIAAFNFIPVRYGFGRLYPYVRGLASGKTPSASLGLKPGELVQVRSKAEIMRTINAGGRNRGLWFDVEMTPFCGKTFRVLSRVEKIIDEKNGKMMNLPNDCITLEGVMCGGCFSTDRLFCPRAIIPYWREIWLTRVE